MDPLGHEPDAVERRRHVPGSFDARWCGQPTINWTAATQNWNAGDTNFNANLRVTVTEWGTDLGVTAALAKTLIYYSAGTRRWATHHVASQTMAKEILDRIWMLYRDSIGGLDARNAERLQPLREEIFIPAELHRHDARSGDHHSPASRSWASGRSTVTIRTGRRCRAYLNGGPAPTLPTTGSGRRWTSRWRTRSTVASSSEGWLTVQETTSVTSPNH